MGRVPESNDVRSENEASQMFGSPAEPLVDFLKNSTQSVVFAVGKRRVPTIFRILLLHVTGCAPSEHVVESGRKNGR